MNTKEALLKLEYDSGPIWVGGCLIPRRRVAVINGRTVEASSRMNKGRSGKGFTTRWTVDGKAIARAELARVLEN